MTRQVSRVECRLAAHIHNKTAAGSWEFVTISDREAVLEMPSLGISIPLIEIYEDAMPADEGRN